MPCQQDLEYTNYIPCRVLSINYTPAMSYIQNKLIF